MDSKLGHEFAPNSDFCQFITVAFREKLSGLTQQVLTCLVNRMIEGEGGSLPPSLLAPALSVLGLPTGCSHLPSLLPEPLLAVHVGLSSCLPLGTARA